MRVDLAPLTELADLLADHADIRTASVDPEQVKPGGVWVQLVGIDYDLLAGYTLHARLVLVVADNGVERSGRALIKLLNAVTDLVAPDGTVTPYPVTLPGSGPKPLPGLAVPVDLEAEYTTPTT